MQFANAVMLLIVLVYFYVAISFVGLPLALVGFGIGYVVFGEMITYQPGE